MELNPRNLHAMLEKYGLDTYELVRIFNVKESVILEKYKILLNGVRKKELTSEPIICQIKDIYALSTCKGKMTYFDANFGDRIIERYRPEQVDYNFYSCLKDLQYNMICKMNLINSYLKDFDKKEEGSGNCDNSSCPQHSETENVENENSSCTSNDGTEDVETESSCTNNDRTEDVETESSCTNNDGTEGIVFDETNNSFLKISDNTSERFTTKNSIADNNKNKRTKHSENESVENTETVETVDTSHESDTSEEGQTIIINKLESFMSAEQEVSKKHRFDENTTDSQQK